MMTVGHGPPAGLDPTRSGYRSVLLRLCHTRTAGPSQLSQATHHCGWLASQSRHTCCLNPPTAPFRANTLRERQPFSFSLHPSLPSASSPPCQPPAPCHCLSHPGAPPSAAPSGSVSLDWGPQGMVVPLSPQHEAWLQSQSHVPLQPWFLIGLSLPVILDNTTASS